MSKYTTTLSELINAQLHIYGFNEFVNNVNGKTQLTWTDDVSDDYAFIKKIIHYDKDVETVVTSKIFNRFSFKTPEEDRFFKKTFVNYFLDREIQRQTIENFSARLVSFCLINETRIDVLYTNLENYYKGQNNSSSANNHIGGNNVGERDLPQDEVNLDLKSYSMNYADSNRISRDSFEDNATNESQSANADVFEKLNYQWLKLFKELDKRCFLQIW